MKGGNENTIFVHGLWAVLKDGSKPSSMGEKPQTSAHAFLIFLPSVPVFLRDTFPPRTPVVPFLTLFYGRVPLKQTSEKMVPTYSNLSTGGHLSLSTQPP